MIVVITTGGWGGIPKTIDRHHRGIVMLLILGTGARCVRKKKLYNTTRGGTHLLAFF
jgi:hypothetical protein